MNVPARVSIGLLLSVVAMIIVYAIGCYISLLFDSNYHDGIGFTFAVVLGIAAFITTFIQFMKKTRPTQM
jgi:hypothetical protein